VIGVIANPSDECIVREFFELFKTPWEFYREGRRYDIVLCSSDARQPSVAPKLLIVYGSRETEFDTPERAQIVLQREGGEILFFEKKIPVLGPILGFSSCGTCLLKDHRSGQPAAYLAQVEGAWFARVGYDLFHEVRTLLTQGQPSTSASIPSLELHIAFLRQLITACGFPLVEIPPVPAGYSFIACLTHDLDHASIKRHKFDATMFGFLYRATVASAINTARGRLSLKGLVTNWTAAAKLPFVYLGLAEDFWYGFDRYLDLEDGRPSTFFVIPFANRPGRPLNGKSSTARGAGYDVSHVATKIQKLKDAGCEIGLHGIDAWNDKTQAREESLRISEVSSVPASGVRMHWLYGDEESPAVLDEANFSYDSTVGYNDTVGYRAGTGQVFKPLRSNRLLELPLHVMDTALFYPDYLDLTDDEAWAWLEPLIENATHHGGVLTFNWHDRSIAPERLWGDFYVRLLGELTRRGALFCTAEQAVAWFRCRRSVVFESPGDDPSLCRISVESNEGIAPLRIRFHRPMDSSVFFAKSADSKDNYTDTIFNGPLEYRYPNC
jgi:hypothetical protein